MKTDAFNALLQRIKAGAKTEKDKEDVQALSQQLDEQKPSDVDVSKLGIDNDTPADTVQDIIEDVILPHQEDKKVLGVAKDVVLNEKQQEFCDAVNEGKDAVLIGAAGTGKTTSMRKTTRTLIDSERLGKISTGTKWLHSGTPGAAILSYTRKAVNNIRHAVVDELKDNTLTIHKLLEFAPVYYEIEDSEHPGFFKKTMRFEPSRDAGSPLPQELSLIVIEESSMVSVELYDQLIAALPHPHQEVFLGDIQQLPPVFGMAILGFKMNTLPVVELTEVYRQALESPIIDLAWKLLKGDKDVFHPRTVSYDIQLPASKDGKLGTRAAKRIKVPTLEALTKSTPAGEVKFQVWQKQLSVDNGLITSAKQFTAWADQNYYDPQNDIILCPFNKALGTIELNKYIADHLGRKRGAVVYEVIAGFVSHYLAVGDRVLYDKEDAYITEIRPSAEYLGKRPSPATNMMDRWGHPVEDGTESHHAKVDDKEDEAFGLDTIDALEKFMESAASDNEERVQAASHTVVIRYAYDMTDDPTDSAGEVVLKSASEINALLGGYAITVHKAQGSEYDKVFLLLHNSHAVMVSRELLYTAVTRAKRFLHIICETNTFYKGIQSQRVKVDTIAQKADFFKGKATEKQIKEEQLKLELTEAKRAEELERAADYRRDPLYFAKDRAKTNLEYAREQEAKVEAALTSKKITWDQPPPAFAHLAKPEVVAAPVTKTDYQAALAAMRSPIPTKPKEEPQLTAAQKMLAAMKKDLPKEPEEAARRD